MRFLIPILLFALVLIPPVLGEGSFTDLAEEVRVKIGQEGDLPGRVSLVDRVAGYDDREAAKLLLESVEILSGKVDVLLRALAKVEAAHEEVNTNQDVAQDEFKTRTELRARIAELEEKVVAHRTVIERIRKSAIGFESEGSRTVVVTLATGGKNWRQRGIAAQAAAGYPTEEGRVAAVRALKDREPRVVIQALFGLRDRKDQETVEPVAACLKIENWVIRAIAAEALAAIGSPKGVRPLIEALAKTEGRVRDDLNNALKALTGQKFVADYEIWKKWYDEHREEFEGEEAKPLARKRTTAPDEGSTYYGIPTPSKRIVYLIDISGSMKLEIGGGPTITPREGEEERPSGPKIEIAKRELKIAIRKLPEDAYFNIITFNHLVKRWEEKMVKATQKNKNKAYIFIRSLEAAGSTYTYGALKEAFKLAGLGAADPNYASGVNTIFLLSDGAPTDQTFPTSKLMEPEKILTAVRQWNALSKVVIHAIAIDPKTQGSAFIGFMKAIADQNGGKYSERG